MLIGIAYDETDGSTSSASLKDTREKLYLVGLCAPRGDCTLPRETTLHLATHKVHIYGDASRHPVYYSADGRSMRLTERSQGKEGTESIHEGRIKREKGRVRGYPEAILHS